MQNQILKIILSSLLWFHVGITLVIGLLIIPFTNEGAILIIIGFVSLIVSLGFIVTWTEKKE